MRLILLRTSTINGAFLELTSLWLLEIGSISKCYSIIPEIGIDSQCETLLRVKSMVGLIGGFVVIVVV